MTDACDCCDAAAVNPQSGLYRAGCVVCQARQVSHAPKHLREAYYASIRDDEERGAFREAVSREWRRREGAR